MTAGPLNSEALWCCGDWAVVSEFLPEDGGDEAWLATAAAAELSRCVMLQTLELARLTGSPLCSVSEMVRLRGFTLIGVG